MTLSRSKRRGGRGACVQTHRFTQLAVLHQLISINIVSSALSMPSRKLQKDPAFAGGVLYDANIKFSACAMYLNDDVRAVKLFSVYKEYILALTGNSYDINFA